MMPPKRTRKKTRNEISTGMKRAALSRSSKPAFAPLEAATNGAAICTSCVGTVCMWSDAVVVKRECYKTETNIINNRAERDSAVAPDHRRSFWSTVTPGVRDDDAARSAECHRQ